MHKNQKFMQTILDKTNKKAYTIAGTNICLQIGVSVSTGCRNSKAIMLPDEGVRANKIAMLLRYFYA